jgi:hypothetical protein
MRHKCLLASVGVGVVALAQLSTAWAQAGPDLVITMLHTGNFTVGENGVYTIVVSNIGGTATSGFYEVDDELNPGPYPGGIDFLFVSETGTGWSCSVNYHMPPNQNVSTACRSTSVIPPGGFAPPITLTVIPPVSGTFTNVADVGGGWWWNGQQRQRSHHRGCRRSHAPAVGDDGAVCAPGLDRCGGATQANGLAAWPELYCSAIGRGSSILLDKSTVFVLFYLPLAATPN